MKYQEEYEYYDEEDDNEPKFGQLLRKFKNSPVRLSVVSRIDDQSEGSSLSS